jgi:hypothetical protein
MLATAGLQPAQANDRLRLIIETDAGGDPDDEQSLVRLLLYANEWDIEGIIANRAEARDGENLNPERTGLGIVQRLVRAYGECYPRLVKHDERYPTAEALLACTVAGYDDTDDAENLIIAAVDRDDPRPLWYLEWGSDLGSGIVNMKRVLDRVLAERGAEEYAAFKRKLRIVGYDQYEKHTHEIEPPFPLWVNTFEPPRDGLRWYHRLSALTATAGGFDAERDLLNDHGPLGAMYPMNTTHTQKEGDSGTFLYLVPTGMNDPEQPTWGSWAGRYGRHEDFPEREYYWANQTDRWRGEDNRDNTMLRWAEHLQNDFRARLDWCVKGASEANHPPSVVTEGARERRAKSGERVHLDAGGTTDRDGDALVFDWQVYPEPGNYRGPDVSIEHADEPRASFVAPKVSSPEELHIVLTVTDGGEPPLSRYGRVIVRIEP